MFLGPKTPDSYGVMSAGLWTAYGYGVMSKGLKTADRCNVVSLGLWGYSVVSLEQNYGAIVWCLWGCGQLVAKNVFFRTRRGEGGGRGGGGATGCFNEGNGRW